MNARHFDALSRALTELGTRRRVLGLLAVLPVLGGMVGLRSPEESAAKDRRRRRKQRHKQRKKPGTRKGKDKDKDKGKDKPPACTPESVAQTCDGRCGSVTNTCNQPVDCGSCACDPPCAECFTCQEGLTTPGTCVVDSAQTGEACGSAGQVCQADGSCTCNATSCPACSVCQGDACVGCASLSRQCCAGQCVDGVCCEDNDCDDPGAPDCVGNDCVCASNGDTACTGGDTCCAEDCFDLETDPEHCGDCGNACAIGLTCQGGVCGVVCGSDFCPAVSEICVDGACQACDVTCTGTPVECGTTLQAAFDGTDETIYVCPGTFEGEFIIDRTVTVIGAGPNMTILDANYRGPVMILTYSSATTRLNGLQVTRGQAYSGAGVYNMGSLTMTNCLVTANDANNTGGGTAGVYNQGTLTMTDCTVSDNTTVGADGGISNLGTLTLTNCLISGNYARRFGGGIVNRATATLDSTTVSGNTSGGSPAGVLNGRGATLTLTNGTSITGNTPGNCGNEGVVNGPGCTL